MDEKYIHHFLFLPFVEFSGQVLAVHFQLFATDLIQLKVPVSRIVVSLIEEIAMAKTWFLSFPCRAIVVSVPQFSRIFVEPSINPCGKVARRGLALVALKLSASALCARAFAKQWHESNASTKTNDQIRLLSCYLCLLFVRNS